MRKLITLALALAIALPAGAAEVRNPVAIDEWTVPYVSSRPRDPDVRSRTEVWFVGQRGHYLARLNPETGEFVRRDLADAAGPHSLVVGTDGIVWYAANLKGYIGRYDPASGVIEKIATANPRARDPHTLIFDQDQRHIWFTVQGGNFVGRLTVAQRAVELIAVPTARARPYGIVIAPDGAPWIALFGTNKLASIDPKSLKLVEYALPDAAARPRRIGASSDGRIYYTDYARGYLGRFDPKTRTVEEWAVPSGDGARPYAMAVDTRDRVWLVETGPSPNTLVGFSPQTETFFSVTPIPSGARSVRHMDYHAATHTVWFGTDANTIGRAKLGE